MSKEKNSDSMLPEYDFKNMPGGVRGKYYEAYREGHTVKIHQEDGNTVVKHFTLEDGAVMIEPDIREYFPNSEAVKRPDRAEADRFWNFPYAAIEEAVVNAMYHRSYEIREPVEVRITPEDLVVLSFPGPDRSIKMEDLKRGKAISRRYRNRRIGDFFKELDLTEGRSTGISKILNQMKNNGSPPPEFETDEDRSFFLIRLPVNPGTLSEKTSEPAVRARPQVTPPVTPPVKNLLVLLEKKGQLGAQLIREGLRLKDRTHTREAYINPALKSGFIEITIPNKPKSRLQEYRLTAKGKRVVRQMLTGGNQK